jgi:hypothetical protein
LGGEVRIQTGEPFEIFQDRKDITLGQQWKKRTDETIDAITFLIPIITPAFFRSQICREELERFIDREKTLGRSDLILPVYYIECPVLHDPSKLDRDPLAKVIAERQYYDWSDLRFESFTSPEVGKRLAGIARQIVAAIDRTRDEGLKAQRWTKARFLEDSRRRLDAPQLAAVEKLLDWSQSVRAAIAWGAGKERGTFSVRFPEVSPSKSVFTVYTDGTLGVNVGWLTESEAALACARSLAACVRSLGLAEVPENFEQKYPSVRIDDWKGKIDAFTRCVEQSVEAARRAATGASGIALA